MTALACSTFMVAVRRHAPIGKSLPTGGQTYITALHHADFAIDLHRAHTLNYRLPPRFSFLRLAIAILYTGGPAR